jgi:hypothetical protein
MNQVENITKKDLRPHFVAMKKCRILAGLRFRLLACLLPKPRLVDAT